MKRLLLAVILFLVPCIAIAQTANVPAEAGTVTLSASQTQVTGSAAVTLSWNSTSTADGTVVQSCQPSWQTSTVTGSGTASVTVAKTTQYTLTCSWNDLSALLSWTTPTLNTDGSAIAGAELPLSYSVFSGAASSLTPLKTGVATSPVIVGPFSVSSICFSLTTVSATGTSSPPTNVICKNLGLATASSTASVTVTVVPQAPGGFTVQ